MIVLYKISALCCFQCSHPDQSPDFVHRFEQRTCLVYQKQKLLSTTFFIFFLTLDLCLTFDRISLSILTNASALCQHLLKKIFQFFSTGFYIPLIRSSVSRPPSKASGIEEALFQGLFFASAPALRQPNPGV